MLIVGLGNPGKRYVGSPHNIGFSVLECFAARTGSRLWRDQFDADVAETTLNNVNLVLIKPRTFMNRSGDSVLQASECYSTPVESTVVVHDELDMPLGRVKLKRGGGEGGHNGLRSISARLASQNYLRLRVGVGRPLVGEITDYLLTPLAEAQQQTVAEAVDQAVAALHLVAELGPDRAMERINRRAPADPPVSEATKLPLAMAEPGGDAKTTRSS